MKHTAKEIKQVLKNNGFKTQKISARDGYITIKDLSISCHQVAKLLQKELGISIYNVEYDMDVFEELVNSKMDEASQLLEEIKAGKEIRKELGEHILSVTFYSTYGEYVVRNPENNDDFRKGGTVKDVYDLAYGLATLEAH
ncbi:hypothetical protein [Streptococcus suis]|uniref:hypothetical protein n=1 Tax=Streptococcus suis TaxID=1307 RepID=UPI0003F9413C|nr:hypothetical protein [Streptococcus suis]